VVQAEAAFASKDYLRAASFFAKVNFLLLNLIMSMSLSYNDASIPGILLYIFDFL
jgi:hypothetical protein